MPRHRKTHHLTSGVVVTAEMETPGPGEWNWDEEPEHEEES